MEMESSVGSAGSILNNAKRQKNTGTEFEDRISSLPDGILVHILSLLPTRDAVQTMLIPRFGELWTSVHSLEFDSCSYHDCAEEDEYENDTCLNLIRHALILHSRPKIFKFSLTFRFSYTYAVDDEDAQGDEIHIRDRKLAKEIDTWIGFAVRREVEVLYLNMMGCFYPDPEYCYVLPNVVFRSCFLTELQLVKSQVKPKGHIFMRSLKKLSLWQIHLSDKALHSILDGCPLLEYLSLLDCYGLRKLNITSPHLRTLVIEDRYGLELSCPTVWSLNFSGWFDKMELKNVSALVNVQLLYSYLFRCEEKEYHEVRGLFERLHHVEVLNLCTWSIMVFTIWELKALPRPSFHCKHLILETFLTKWHLHGITSLLRNSPRLESLSIEVKRGSRALPDVQTKWLEHYDYDEAKYWNMIEPFDCLINKLKSVNIYPHERGTIIHSHVIQLVKFLLKSSFVLEKIVITTKPDGEPQWSERLLEFTKTLSSFLRASSKAVILYI